MGAGEWGIWNGAVTGNLTLTWGMRKGMLIGNAEWGIGDRVTGEGYCHDNGKADGDLGMGIEGG